MDIIKWNSDIHRRPPQVATFELGQSVPTVPDLLLSAKREHRNAANDGQADPHRHPPDVPASAKPGRPQRMRWKKPLGMFFGISIGSYSGTCAGDSRTAARVAWLPIGWMGDMRNTAKLQVGGEAVGHSACDHSTTRTFTRKLLAVAMERRAERTGTRNVPPPLTG